MGNKSDCPHMRENIKTSRLMLDVVLALVPSLLVGVWRLGIRALAVAAVAMLAALGSEGLYGLLSGKQSVRDGSALVTGLLLAMTLPVSVPMWLVVGGSAFAIVVGKLLWGGLGQNLWNPALGARAAMLLLFPAAMTDYRLDGFSSATPLHHMVRPALPGEGLWALFLGNCPGSIGELSTLALLLGGMYLVVRRVISLHIPLAYLGSVAVLTLVLPKTGNGPLWMAYSLCSGALMLGAVFMATDYATSPVVPKAQVVYGIGCGCLTVLYRYFGLFPEGVSYAILTMNCLSWELDRWMLPRRFGVKRGEKE